MVVYSRVGSEFRVLLSVEVERCEDLKSLLHSGYGRTMCNATKILTVRDEAVGENVGQRLVGSTEIEPGG